MSAPKLHQEFDLPHGLYYISDIQDYFEYILKNQEKVTDNPSMRIYINKIENGITFKIKTGYYLEHSTSQAMKLLGHT